MTGRGWAATADATGRRLSYLAIGPTAEPTYAIADYWTEPPMALPVELCGRILLAARAARPIPSGNGTYYLPDLDADIERAVVGRFAAANDLWWQLHLTDWFIGVKRYQPGDAHPEHQDIHAAGGGLRKFAGVAQLSDPGSYDGGELRARFAQDTVPVPRTVGTLLAMPAWTCHEVLPVTRGERWSLICNANGPKLR